MAKDPPSSPPPVRPLTEGFVRKGGLNTGPTQVAVRPPPPAPINVPTPAPAAAPPPATGSNDK